MSSPNPALVPERAAQRLPRIPLLLLCVAYVLPGVFDRDPWRNADIAAFGYMANLAAGPARWIAPMVGGVPAQEGPLPYWIGAVAIRACSPWLDPAIAARLPFALLLVMVLALTWASTYHLARTAAAQPLPLAFGGEAKPVDYARAIADGALLALIASLGLLQLGHETTPELAQLAGVALFLHAVSRPPGRRGATASLLLALPALAASGAPSIALGLGVVTAVVGWRSDTPSRRSSTAWVLAGTALAAIVATALGAWRWRIGAGAPSLDGAWQIVRLLAWFAWPSWLLAVWTIWQWRYRLVDRHIAVPLACVGVSVCACIGMGGSDRALLLGLPPLAVLAAFALPTLQRSAAAAIDWFSVCLFTIAAAVVWVVYASMQTGVPAQPAVNIARLSPDYTHRFSAVSFGFALLGSIAWLALVRWRTGRTRHPLWKSLVLPASGVALCWLLVMTLLLPPLDAARSSRALVARIAKHLPSSGCVAAPGLATAEVAALEYFGRRRVDAATSPERTRCSHLLRVEPQTGPPAPVPAGGWKLVARERRTRNDDAVTAVYQRAGGA